MPKRYGLRGLRAAVVALCLCAVFAGGCAASPTDEPARSSDREKAADTARVVCGPGGTRVLTPRVEARPDGVHYIIDNRFGAEVGYSIEYQEGGGEGDSVPRGESEHVGDFPPGEVRIGCEKPPVDGTDVDYGVLEVMDPDGVYKAVELECGGGMAVSGEPQYAEGAKGKKGDPVGITRRSFANHIRDGDRVELAGYPQIREHRTVRVVRDARVIATVAYIREAKGWLKDHYEACERFQAS